MKSPYVRRFLGTALALCLSLPGTPFCAAAESVLPSEEEASVLTGSSRTDLYSESASGTEQAAEDFLYDAAGNPTGFTEAGYAETGNPGTAYTEQDYAGTGYAGTAYTEQEYAGTGYAETDYPESGQDSYPDTGYETMREGADFSGIPDSAYASSSGQGLSENPDPAGTGQYGGDSYSADSALQAESVYPDNDDSDGMRDREREEEDDSAGGRKDEEDNPFGDTVILEETYGMDFSSCRLLMAADEGQIVDPVHIMSSYNGVFLMQYGTEDEARLAYSYYKNTAWFAEPDIEMFVADDQYLGSGTAAGENLPADAVPGESLSAGTENGEGLSAGTENRDGLSSGADDGQAAEVLPEAPDGMTEEMNPLTELAQEMPAVSSVSAGTIAVIDTGMDLNGNVTDRISVIGDDPGDDNGHGNLMAELILQQAPQAGLLSVKAIGADGRGNISSVYAAMQYAIAAGPEIILLPVSAAATAENAVLQEAVGEAVERGILVVGAAGNNGQDAAYFTPGGIEAAIIAGAADSSGARISSSNYGATVDYYIAADSTSQAAATLAGALAAQGELTGVNEDGLIFTPDFVPSQAPGEGENAPDDGENTPDDGEKTPDSETDTYYLVAEDGSFVTSDTIQVSRFEYTYGDMPLGVHYITSTGQLLYCIEPEKSSSGGSYGSINMPNSREKTVIAYIIANGLQRMNSRSANPAYVAARSDTRTHGSWTLYNRDYEITQMAVWHVMGKEFALGNAAENAQRVALYTAAENYARTNADGNYYIRELKMPSAGSEMPLKLSSDGRYYESADFTVSNRNGMSIEVSISGGPDGASVIQTGGIVDGDTLTRTYRVRVPAAVADSWQAGKKTWTITARGSGSVYSVGTYRKGGDQAVTLLTTSTSTSQTLTASASLTVVPSTAKLRLIKQSSAGSMTDGNDGYSLAGAVYGIYKSEKDADEAAASGSLSGKEAGSFITGADGSSPAAELTQGTYYVREIKASPGFLPDRENHMVTVEAGKDSTVTMKEEPAGPVPGIRIRKINGKTEDTSQPFGSSLEGAEYTICFYAKTSADPAEDKPAQTWVIKTIRDKDGHFEACLDANHLVSGSEAPYGKTGEGAWQLPLGTVTLQETKAPKGFEKDSRLYTGHIRVSGSGSSSILWDTLEGAQISPEKESGEELLHREIPFEPDMETEAADKENGTHLGTLSEEAVVTDTVRYSGLTGGEKYRLEASLINKADKSVICKVTKEDLTCDASGSGEWTVEFPPIDSTALQDNAAVAFEKLYIGKELVVSHEDPDDEDQTVHYPELPHKKVDRMSNCYEKADHTWTVTQKIPDGYAALKVKDLVIEDKLDDRLSWDSFVSLVIRDAAGIQLEEGDYTVQTPQEPSGGTLVIRIDTPSGTEKLAANEGRILELKFKTRINSSAVPSEKIVYEEKDLEENDNDALIPNQAVVRIGQSANWTEIPYLYTAGISVRKADGSDRPLAGAVFSLLDAGKKPFIRDGEAYMQTTGEDGLAEFAGLENGTYYLRETQAPAGMELLKEDIKVLIEQGVVSSVNGVRLSGSDRTITVRDNGQIVLMTGGPGLRTFTLPGLLLLLAGITAGLRRRRKSSI